jgi:tetratricopeptide (TPR) repeat protein
MSSPFFLRFRWSDAAALQREIAEAQVAYRTARVAENPASEIEVACRLATGLIAADREAEAAVLLEDALLKARTLNAPSPTAWVLLGLATARQYLGQGELAQTIFAEALEITQTNNLRDIEHFVLHHRGRCYAEQNELDNARRCFKRALEIRLALGEPRAERTREALVALDNLPPQY